MKNIASLSAVILLAVLGLLGCSVLPAQAAPPQMHDFGPLPTPAEGAGRPVRVDRVVAPAWIDDGGIHYRLVYSDPTSLRSYADHRWVAAPSDMLRLRLQTLLAGGATADQSGRSLRLLNVELVEFEQDFSAAQQASVRLVARASLRDAVDGTVVAEQEFVLSLPTTPDVHGAVSDMSKAAEQAAEQVAAWCDENQKAPRS